MEGLILAAGMGTRLRPLTETLPKALVKVQGKTLLEIAIARLEAAGVEHIVVNVHHFADMVKFYLIGRRWKATIDISDESGMLLDTGGAIKKASALLTAGEEVLVHNVDVLSTIDLDALRRSHLSRGNLVTLCCARRATRRMLAFDDDGRLTGRCQDAEPSAHCMAFSGISIVSPRLFPLLPAADHPYPIIDQYLRLAATHPICCHEHPAAQWLDVGKPETLQIAERWKLF